MRKMLSILGIIIVIGLIGGIVSFISWIMVNSPEAVAREKFLSDFDLRLKGRITDVLVNDNGLTLVCLDVLETNYVEYFPIYNPNEGSNEDIWERRFFIKVENKKAVFICDNHSGTSIYNKLKKGAYVVINRNNNKAFEVFETEKTNIETDIGLSIITYPILNNIEISCLNSISE